MLFSSFSILEHSAVTLAATNVFDICFNRFNLWLGKQYMEYTNKSNGKWILPLTQWQWLQCTQPGGEKNRVNYCLKSSCEINETLRALCWLKRSLPTFNRLFNLTQLELCVCVHSFPFWTQWHAPRMPTAPPLAEMFLQMKTGCPLYVIRARAHQAALIERLAFSFAKRMAVIAIFVFLPSFSED